MLAVGYGHTCSLTSNQDLYCWGLNDDSQLGDGTFTSRALPVRIGAEQKWLHVAAGKAHTCAVSTDKQMYCWGRGDSGQLGDNRARGHRVPTAIRHEPYGRFEWGIVTAGDQHTCATAIAPADTGMNARLYCWGDNTKGQLAAGTLPILKEPASADSRDYRVLSAGAAHTCGVTTGLELYCWGAHEYGQLGNGHGSVPIQRTPQRVGYPFRWVDVRAGATHSCGLRDLGTEGTALYCWGDNDFGQLGNGTTQRRYLPEPL